MNTISGRVQIRETRAGAADLVVVVYDLDPRTLPEELFDNREGANGGDLWTRIRGDRLGSVATGPDGSFKLVYDDAAFRERGCERRPDLLLLVTAPEGADAEACPEILHVSCGVRQNAGREEYYLIRLARERLERAGLLTNRDVQIDVRDPRAALERLESEAERDAALRDGVREVAAARVARERRRRAGARERFADPARLLSAVSAETRRDDAYVAPGESVATNTARVLRRGVENRINEGQNAIRKAGLLSLNPQQRAAVTDQGGNLRGGLRANDLTPLLNGPIEVATPFLPIDLIRVDPRDFCRDETNPDMRCEGPDGGAPDNLAVDGVPHYIARLVDSVTSPEMAVRLDEGTRASVGDVERQIDGLQLRGGPADTPAVYDFHQLQIAFEHVWQEAFDEDLLNQLRETYQQIEDLGGNPGAAFESLIEEGALARAANTEEAPSVVTQAFEITIAEWNALSTDQRQSLVDIATAYIALFGAVSTPVQLNLLPESLRRAVESALQEASDRRARTLGAHLRRIGQNIIRYGGRKVDASQGVERLHHLIEELRRRASQRYGFTIYAANREERSVNFGVLVTYRQTWDPLTYQAGQLVKAVPLAPKETRKFTKKVTTKRRRAEKEVANSLRSRREELTQTSRVEEEIVRRAATKTNFGLTTEGDFDIGIASGKATTSFATEASAASEDVKREFREAVFKAAEEVKNERTVEVNTEASDDVEVEESGEVSNPNEELTVTYLFYELQRRYRVSERIHRVRPVILVAQEVPLPNEIDEGWIVAHDWILRRVLLDDSFAPALVYLATRIAGDEFALEEQQKNVDQQRRLVESISEELTAYREQTGQRYGALEQSIQKHIDAVDEEESEGFFWNVGEFFAGDDTSPEGQRLREDAARDAYEQAAREERELRARLEREVSALDAMSGAYTKALAEHQNRKAQVERLKVHVKENILHYMQAIWSHEPPDQRFFRLHNVRVPRFTGQVTYDLSNAPNNAAAYPNWSTPAVQVEAHCHVDLPLEFGTLSEVADLDNVVGYKGNYMIFPLKQPNCLTDFMMTPYIDAALGLRDPDELGNWTIEEFVNYVCCLRSHMSQNAFAELRDTLRQQFRRLLTAPRRASEELVVPTGSLFIEALPGTHPILEDFKLKHRAMDVKKVQAEVRRAELENLRLAARLLTDEYRDPDIDRMIVIEGNGQDVVVGPDN